MKHLLTLFIIFASVTLYSQTLKKTYYDEYGKTMLKESYYVNSAGYGNGAYKKYWKDGNLTLKGTYKNGSKEGVWTSYSRSSGKQQVSQTETFKDNDLNGPAVYYASDKNGRRIMSQGSYLNGEKHGKWSFINPFDSYGYSEEDKKGAKYLKFDKYYNNGKEVFPDGEMKIYYSPSGQVCTVSKYLNGIKNGEWTYYFPNGDLNATEVYGENGRIVLGKYYHSNGVVKAVKDWRSGSYFEESFDEQGNPDEYTIRARKKKEEELKKKIRKKELHRADSLIVINEYSQAAVIYAQYEVSTENLDKFIALYQSYLSGKSSFIDFENEYKLLYSKGFSTTGQLTYCKNIFNGEKNKFVDPLERANAIILAGYYDEALIAYTELGVKTDLLEYFNTQYKKYLKGEILMTGLVNEYNSLIRISKDYPSEQMDYCENVILKEQKKVNEIGVYEEMIKDEYKAFNSVFTIEKKTSLVDAKGDPIMKTTYPRGKFLYRKAKVLLDSYVKEYLLAKEISRKKELAPKISNLVISLNNIPESEWKGLNKQLKKVDDPEQIKSILKI